MGTTLLESGYATLLESGSVLLAEGAGAGGGRLAGTASLVSSGPGGITLSATSSTGGSADPDVDQWERATVTGGVTGTHADLAGETGPALLDSTAAAGVLYSYRLKQAKDATTVTTNAVEAQVYTGGALTGGTPGEVDDVTAQEIIDETTAAVLAALPAAVWDSAPAGTPLADVAAAVWDEVIETGVDARQALAVIGAACAGKASGLDTATATYYAMGPSGTSTARIQATTTTAGNRTATTLTLPS